MPRQVLIDPILADRTNEWARRIIRVAMTGKGFSYADLARLLVGVGIHDNERNLRNKVSRGEFSAAFLLTCLKVMGVKSIDLEDWNPDKDDGVTLDGRKRT